MEKGVPYLEREQDRALRIGGNQETQAASPLRRLVRLDPSSL